MALQFEEVIGSSYYFFTHSSERKTKFKHHFQLLNEGMEPLQLIKLSTTRWLSILTASQRIKKYWNDLKSFFNSDEVLYLSSPTAARLGVLYRDNSILVYISYVVFILKEVILFLWLFIWFQVWHNSFLGYCYFKI